MDKIEELRTQLATMLDKTEDKDMISDITNMTNSLNAIEEENKSLDSKYRELLGNYKEVIKHTSFKPKSNEEVGTGLPKEKSLDDIITDVINAKINNK